MSYDFHLDIETLSTAPNAAVIQIGMAVRSNVKLDSLIVSIPASWYHNNAHSFDISEDTLRWWSIQSAQAQASLTINQVSKPQRALIKMLQFMHVNGFDDKSTIWANAPTFDCTIMRHMFTAFEAPVPWNFWQERCVRTIKRELGEFFGPPPVHEELTAHRADHDALKQMHTVDYYFGCIEDLKYER